MAPRKKKEKKEKWVISLDLQVAEGENVLVCATSLHSSVILLSTSQIFLARKLSAV